MSKSSDLPRGRLVGRVLTHYRVEELVGVGGTGEVYRAVDLKLGRSVALKTLPDSVSADAAELGRFIHEAKAASSLNHPNIAHIYELNEAEGVHFIAMEFVEGRMLNDILRSGPVPTDRVSEIATQICAALEEAHSKGIVHRDIKPGNVAVTLGGLVKVLDFGLAKLEPANSELTMTQPDTSMGFVMGTIPYMSPEQILGQDVDARSDIFSVGVLLYEAFAGRRPFTGPTPAAVFDAILHAAPPPPSELNGKVSQAHDLIVGKALQKDREQRYQNCAELRADLRRVDTNLEHELTAKTMRGFSPMNSRGRYRRWWLALPVAAVVIAGLFWSVRFLRESSLESKVSPITSFDGSETNPDLSRDGKLVVYAWNGPQLDNYDIYLQQISGGSPLRLTTDPAWDSHPVFSPDGQTIAFVRDRKNLMLVSALGGTERRIGTVEHQDISFTQDGKWIASGGPSPPRAESTGIVLTSLTGESPRALTHPPPGQSDNTPRFSPDGREVAFVRVTGVSTLDLFVQAVAGGETKQLTRDKVIIEGLSWTGDSRDIVFSSTRGGMQRLWRIRASGGEPVLVPFVGPGAWSPSVAQQAPRLAYNYHSRDLNIYRLDLDSGGQAKGAPLKIQGSTQPDTSPHVSSDSRLVTFASNRTGHDEIWTSPADGGLATQVTAHPEITQGVVGSPRWSPDGGRIAFDARVDGNADVYVINADGSGKRRVTDNAAIDVLPSWSRDGRWIYFNSRRSGQPEIWKVPAEGGAAQQITRNLGFFAQESPDGKTLYFCKNRTDTAIWRIGTSGGPEEIALKQPDGKPVMVVQFSYWDIVSNGIYCVTRVPDTAPSAPGRQPRYNIEFYNFEMGTSAKIHEMSNPPGVATGGLSVALDRRFLLFVQLDRDYDDLMLLDGFR